MQASIDTDDEQLMLMYAQGNVQAFKLLYIRYEQPIYRFAYNGCTNEANARELFQDTWLRVVNARYSFKPTQSFKAWLFTIARNLLTDSYRKNATNAMGAHADSSMEADPDKLTPASLDAAYETTASALTPEQIASACEQGDMLRKALQLLPLEQRDAIMLKHIAGFNINEIALIQDQNTQTVKSRLRYAMVKLRHYLKEPA